MHYAIQIERYGGPENLQLKPMDLPPPSKGEVQIKQTAVGLNFIDTYHRTGYYPLPELPATLGREAAGIVEAVGEGVDNFKVGDRVGYPLFPEAYCSARNIPAHTLVKLPEFVDDQVAAATLLKGLTAWYLLRRTFEVSEQHTILIHAAAGGVGSIAVQWAKALGATVIGGVGSQSKLERAKKLGCDHVVLTSEPDWDQQVLDWNSGEKLPVVYDSVGPDTFMKSLDCIAPRGLMVSFGQSSGAMEPILPGLLATKGSLYLTRPTLVHYLSDPAEKQAGATELFERIQSQEIQVEIGQSYALKDCTQAHKDLEARRTQGSTVLIP